MFPYSDCEGQHKYNPSIINENSKSKDTGGNNSKNRNQNPYTNPAFYTTSFWTGFYTTRPHLKK